MLGKGYGLGRYVEQLVQHIQEVDTTNEYVLFLRKENWDACDITNKNVTKVLADIPWYSLAEQVQFSKIIKKEGIDLMHFPHFNVPLFYNRPFVVTIHDLTMFHYPRPEATTHGPFVYWIKDRIHRLVVRHAVRASKHILTASEYVKQDIHETFGCSRSKMTTTYQAPFEDVEDQRSSDEGYIDMKKYGIRKPYVLYVGAAYPHKNLERLVEGWDLLDEQTRASYQLVFAGKNNFFYERLAEQLGTRDDIVITGFVPDHDLVQLYKHSSLFVFPSLSEGFGYPPLEAFVHGTPVISSNRTSLPEVLGEGALYIDPESSEHIAEAMLQVLSDEELQHNLVQKGKKELHRFSWKRLAQETIDVYTNCIQTSV